MDTPQAIQWPKAKIGGIEFTFRHSFAASQRLVGWGFNDPGLPAPITAYAAAQSGNFDEEGNWKTARWKHWMDVADLIRDDEQVPLIAAVQDALKKAGLGAQTKTQANPAEPASTTKTDGSAVGLSEPPA